MVFVSKPSALAKLNAEGQDLFDYRGHVVVFILREAATEEYVGFLCGEGAVFIRQLIVLIIINRIVLFHAGLILRRVFFTDDCLGAVIDGLTEHLEVFMFYDTSIGLFVGSIVDHCIALVVGGVDRFCLEADCSPVELAVLIIEVLVDWAGVDNPTDV